MAKPYVKHDFDYLRCFACDKRQHTTILLYRVGHHEGVLGGTTCDSVKSPPPPPPPPLPINSVILKWESQVCQPRKQNKNRGYTKERVGTFLPTADYRATVCISMS